VEVLVATGLLVTAIVSLAQLFTLATRANVAAGDMTWTTVLAAQKIEELRAQPFPERLIDQSIEYLDSRGDKLDAPASAGGRAYTRRWWIAPLSPASDDTIAITVEVLRYRLGDDGTLDSGAGMVGAARVVTLRTRSAR
jgi:hypothetical protein